MNVKTMEGLVGAKSNSNLSDTAMGVYRQAVQKGDTATAQRALGYAGDMVNQAEAYETKAKEGMKEDTNELNEKAKAQQEKIIEKRREDQKDLENQIEQSRKPNGDTIQISKEGKPVSPETSDTETEIAHSAQIPSNTDTLEMPSVLYNSAGEVSLQKVPEQAEISVVI